MTVYRVTLTDMRTFEAQVQDYKHYHEAREAFNNFCNRAGLTPGIDDAAGGIEYKFHIHIQKIEGHENLETNISGIAFGNGGSHRTDNNNSGLANW